MTIVLNGSSGITNDGGYTGDGVVFADTTPANTLVTTTGGNVGIGTSSPGSFNASANKLVVGSGTGNNGATIYAGSASQAAIYFADGTAGAEPYAGQFIYNHADNSFLTYVNGTTFATKIDSSGNLLVSKTVDTDSVAGTVITLVDAGGAGKHGKIKVTNTVGTGQYILQGLNASGGTVGGVTTTSTTTSFPTSSDYRLKENIAPMTGALAVVQQLNPVTYTWKSNGEATQGFIAHELQAVVPECVVGEKDAVDAEGKPIYQGIDTSFLVATLTAAIQELKAINDAQAETITALTARVSALDARLTSLEGTKCLR